MSSNVFLFTPVFLLNFSSLNACIRVYMSIV
jgi:hypothetical protein